MVSSWEGSASTNVPRIPVAPLIMGRVDEDISTRSPELGEQMSWNKNHLSRAPADACIPPPPFALFIQITACFVSGISVLDHANTSPVASGSGAMQAKVLLY